MKKQVLIVEDDPIMQLGMSHLLKSRGYHVTACADGEEGYHAIGPHKFDLIITDLKLPRRDGFALLEKARNVSPQTGVIIITGHAEIKSSVQAIKMGAFDYLAKPFSNEEFLVALDRYFKFRNLEDELAYLKESLKEKAAFENIIGVNPAMKDVFDRIASVAGVDIPVLIQGESGTGKELVANAIHRLSQRADKQMIRINCAAIPETLFESELFGHERGAFTGAAEARKGKFEYADGGTIFFDEIGDIPVALQPKLLRVLEDNAITRLGGNVPIQIDVRCIYATRMSLRESVASRTFREDLFYRINVVPITLPPLRERKEDIPYLIDHFLAFYSEKFRKPGLKLSQHAYDALLAYNYPGNVRELKHAIERAIVLSKEGTLELKSLPDEISGASDRIPCITEDLSLEASLRCFERQRILRALDDAGGKKIEAAAKLGISRKVLWKKMKEYAID